MIVSDTFFLWFVTCVLLGSSAFWVIRDTWFFSKTRKGESDEVVRRDKFFGVLTGLAIGIIGIVGVLRYHLGT